MSQRNNPLDPNDGYYYDRDKPNVEAFAMPEWEDVVELRPDIQEGQLEYEQEQEKFYPANEGPGGTIPFVKVNEFKESTIWEEHSTQNQRLREARLAVSKRLNRYFSLSLPPKFPNMREFTKLFTVFLLKTIRFSSRNALLGLLSILDMSYSKEEKPEDPVQPFAESYLGRNARSVQKTHTASNTNRLYGECRTTNGHSHNGDYYNVDNHNYKDTSKEYKALIRFFDYYALISVLILAILLLINWLLGGVSILNYIMLSVIISIASLLYVSWCISKDYHTFVKLS